jgi:hypothetical protein
MKQNMIIGIVLIVLGAGALILGAVTYDQGGISFTTSTREREKVVDLPGLQVTAEKEKESAHTVARLLPLIVGGMAFAGGIALVVVASKKSA